MFKFHKKKEKRIKVNEIRNVDRPKMAPPTNGWLCGKTSIVVEIQYVLMIYIAYDFYKKRKKNINTWILKSLMLVLPICAMCDHYPKTKSGTLNMM